MWDAIFILAALASPLLLLALAAGLAGPIVKIKVRFGLIALLVVATTMWHVIWEIVSNKHDNETNIEL